MKLNRIGYLIREGVCSIFTHGFMSFACFLVIAACLLIMGVFAVLAHVVDLNIDKLESQNEILAFVDENLSDEEAKEIITRIEAVPNVKSARFVSREEAFENFVESYGAEDEDMFSDLPVTVLRNRYVIYLDDLTLMAATNDAIQEVNGIAETSAALEISRGFIAVRNVLSVVSVVLIVILFVVSVFIMQNTIKLATFSRREEIGIMKMVGATNSFIRCPFIVEGLILGILGGLAAFFSLWGVYTLISEKASTGMIASIITVPSFASLMSPVLLVYLAMGFIVGTFGSNIAIRNYLKV